MGEKRIQRDDEFYNRDAVRDNDTDRDDDGVRHEGTPTETETVPGASGLPAE